MNAALESVLERSLAASSGMDLSLDDKFALIESLGHGLGLVGSVSNTAWLCGNAEFGEEFSGLEFVDIHWEKLISQTNTQPSLKVKELVDTESQKNQEMVFLRLAGPSHRPFPIFYYLFPYLRQWPYREVIGRRRLHDIHPDREGQFCAVSSMHDGLGMVEAYPDATGESLSIS